MTDSQVVEELLEKGARAEFERVRVPGDWDDLLDDEARHALRDQFAAGLDAVFPGWREGITREWTCNHRSHLSNSFEGARWLAERDEGCDPVYTRVVVTSAWVPVEEGTDG